MSGQETDRAEELAKRMSELFGIEETDDHDFLALLDVIERTEERRRPRFSSYFFNMTTKAE